MISRVNEPRQLYGLGSFVKKIGKGIKKVAKSPIGKAALIGGGLWGLNKWGPLAGKIGPMFSGGWDKFKGLSAGKKALLGLGAAGVTLPFMAEEEEDIIETPWNETPSSIASLRDSAQDFYRGTPDYITSPFMPQKKYVLPEFYAAHGGRAGLLNGGQPGQAHAENMLKMQYQKYRNQGGTMSYQQFKMAVLKQAQQQGPMAQQQSQAQPQMMSRGGRTGFYPGGPAGGASAGGNYGGDSSGGDYQGAGAGRSVAQGGQFGNSYDDYGWIPSGTVGGTNLATDTLQSNVVTKPSTLDKIKGLWSNLRNPTLHPEEVTEEDVIYSTSGYEPTERLGEKKDKLKQSGALDELRAQGSLETGMLKGGRVGLKGGSGIGELAKKHWGKGATALGGATWYPDIMAALQHMGVFNEGGRVGLANGGVPGSHVAGYTTPAAYNKFDYPSGGVRVAAANGGIMPLLDLGGKEKDYRQDGGFVGIGRKEKADDVPARLSKNEFVFTADAVRNAGDGDIDAGAEVMDNMMKHLESGGQISEESQGIGAQGMYDNMKQLETRIA